MKVIFKILPLCFSTLLLSQDVTKIKNLDNLQKERFFNLVNKDSKTIPFLNEHQLYLDSIISIIPEDPFYWQQKAMPLFKQKKYELGMKYLNRAIEYDTTNHYKEYRAFIKCIFQKNYTKSLDEFLDLTKINGDAIVMDHTYSFWIGLCYLQLNEFQLSKKSIEKSIAFGKVNNYINPYELFYLGITEFEMGNYNEAIKNLDISINEYKNFADAKYYKALSLAKIGKETDAKALFLESKSDFKNGFTFNEGNSLYEQFPYQASQFTYISSEKLFLTENN